MSLSREGLPPLCRAMTPPIIIQGGMGVGVSNWILARAVSQLGQLGVVSGTLLPVVLARRLQQGDPGGHMRRALAAFPLPAVAGRILATYFVEGGLGPRTPFKLTPMPALPFGPVLSELTVVANFCEVFLTKEGHDGRVGLNLLEKIQIPTLASLYGAMLAGVDYVLMGAGIPRSIPGMLDKLAAGEVAELKIDITDNPADTPASVRFDPAALFGGPAPALTRPQFLAIVSSATLALTLARKSNGRVDGFIVETATAGGHNAPPRGPMQLSASGEPIYGDRDRPELDKIRALGLPFWLAGSQSTAEQLAIALSLGATGVQVGTAFAFCEESGITPSLKRHVCALALSKLARVHTDPNASPTGLPFKVLPLAGTVSANLVYESRQRTCDLGYLREVYRKPDGEIGYRCPAEPAQTYARKDGDITGCAGRKCLCNGLLATIGLGQNGETQLEPAIITAGQDVATIGRFLKNGRIDYKASDVIDTILATATAHAGFQNAGEGATVAT
jgi:nitronate monooxygenase